jgi:hypothetical protein
MQSNAAHAQLGPAGAAGSIHGQSIRIQAVAAPSSNPSRLISTATTSVPMYAGHLKPSPLCTATAPCATAVSDRRLSRPRSSEEPS